MRQGLKTFIYSFPVILILYILVSIVYSEAILDKFFFYGAFIISGGISLLLSLRYNQKWLDRKRREKAEREYQKEMRRKKQEEWRRREQDRRNQQREERAIRKALQEPLAKRVGRKAGKFMGNFKEGFNEEKKKTSD